MKLVFYTLFIVLGKNLEEILKNQNFDLEKINENLHRQLYNLAQSFEIQIQEDYFYNKQKIKSLVSEYEKEQDDLVKIFLAEEMLEYLQGIVEDSNLLGGRVEGVESKELLKILQDLMKSTKKRKQLIMVKENANFYNQLHGILIQKQELVQELQAENAKIYGKIEKKQAEIAEVNRKLGKTVKKYEDLQDEMMRVKDNHSLMTQELEKSFSSQTGVKLSELKDEDSQILSLQSQNNENSLTIEKYNTEISVLNSNLRLLTEKSAFLDQDLQQKSEIFLANNEKFTFFAGSVRVETISQALSVEKSSDQLQSERKDLESKSKQLKIQLDKCESEVITSQSLLKTKDLIIEEYKKELIETDARKSVALDQREKEVQSYSIQHCELTSRISVYQKELDETMQKLSEKATEIQDLRLRLKGASKSPQKY